VPVASVLSQITDAITTAVGDYGLYAVFLLMLVDALLPAASEVVMVYGGALAAGAFSDHDVVLFGRHVSSGLPAYVAIALAGTIGYTIGSIGGWAIGLYGGRPFIERHGRWLHMSPEKLDRADGWFDRHGDAFVFFGRVTPVIRSFIAIPAGIGRVPLGRYTVFTFLGSAVWCFSLAAVGWALGANWERFHKVFHYVDYLVIGLIVVGAAVLLWRWRSRRSAARARAVAQVPEAPRPLD
jgi:membrane protein DedA with SNARE-associated domain